MNMERIIPIARPTHKIGYFEISYRHPDGLKTACLVAYGFQDAVARFKGFNLGEYASLREIDQARFEAWFNVSLNGAKTLQELRTGGHL